MGIPSDGKGRRHFFFHFFPPACSAFMQSKKTRTQGVFNSHAFTFFLAQFQLPGLVQLVFLSNRQTDKKQKCSLVSFQSHSLNGKKWLLTAFSLFALTVFLPLSFYVSLVLFLNHFGLSCILFPARTLATTHNKMYTLDRPGNNGNMCGALDLRRLGKGLDGFA